MDLNLELEIEHGGESEQLANGLKTSTQTYGEDALMSVGTGAAGVVASTGINIGVGTTDQIIADNISAAINLTGEQGLTNVANNLQNYTEQLTALGLNAPEELVNIILDEITAVLAKNGVIDIIKTGMQVTQGTVELAKGGLQYASSIGTVIANIQKLLLKLNKMQDADVMCIPSVKDSLSVLTASLINQLKAQFEALKQQLLIFYNSMICTSNDSTLDNVVVSVNNILEVIEPAIDPLMQKYTGHTVSEIRNICNQGFAYIGMIQRSAARKRQQKEDEENVIISQEQDETIEDQKKKLSKEEKEKLKQQRREKAKKKWEEKSKDLSVEQAREKLFIWVKDQSIMIQNAFHLLIIKDTIDSIKYFLQQLQNTSIENQMDLLNTINTILDLFELFGLTPDAKGITFDDLKKLGMAVAGTAVETVIDIGNQVQENAQEFTDNMINKANENIRNAGGIVLSENVIQDAKGTVASISDKAIGFSENAMNNSATDGSFITSQGNSSMNMTSQDSAGNIVNVASNTTKAVGSDIITGMIDQGMTNTIGAGLSMDMNAIANGNIPTIETNAFTYVQSNENKNIYVDVTINKNPSLHLLSISSFISSFRSGTKEIFNNGAKKQIKDGFKEAWEINDTVELKIQAIVNGITKFYIFTFNINQSARKNSEKYDTNTNENNVEDDLFSKAKNAGNNIKNGATSILNGAKDQAMGIASNVADTALDNVSDVTKDVMSQLTKVGININADLIESVLYDQETGKMKILMFDEVIQFLKILQPLVKTLQVIAHILENYIINKEFVRTKQHVNLADAIRNAAQLINGLLDILNLKDTNFFVIRTEEMANWALSEFKTQPDETGFITINILQTTVLNTYCSTHLINPDYPLDLLKGTTLYFDKWGIQYGGYNDGTTNGLDNIEINRDAQEVYYDKQNRSTISSEILRARKKNVDPYYTASQININKMSKSKDDDMKSFIDAISFGSDEIEGSQTLSISDLNLCSPKVKDNAKKQNANNRDDGNNGNNGGDGDNGNNGNIDKNKTNNSAVIVEFGDEYTLGEKVEYSLVVKPGQTLIEGDKIGYIKNSDKWIPIRTIYTGTIRSIDNKNSDFSHLYPQMATRHIIIDNPVKCSASDYDINDVMSLSQKFKKATELEALIVNCMPISVLPGLLVNAIRTNQQNNVQSGLNGISNMSYSSYTAYDNIIKQYDAAINSFAENLKNDSENFKNVLSGQDETTSKSLSSTTMSSMTSNSNNKKYSEEKGLNGSLTKALQTMNTAADQPSSASNKETSNKEKEVINIQTGAAEELRDKMLNDRKKIVELAISSYNDALEQKNASIFGDIQYLDCVGLAYNPNTKFERYAGDNKLEYNNYYINLLKSIPDTQKQTSVVNINMSDIQAEIDKLHLSDASIKAGYHVNMNNDFVNTENMLKNVNNIKMDDDGPNYIQEFKDIIKEIIDIRLAYEKQTTTQVVEVFNTYYKKNIKDIGKQFNGKAFNYLNDYIQKEGINKDDSQEILKKIKIDKLKLKNSDGWDVISSNEDEKSLKNILGKNDAQTYHEVCKQALTMFMYISNADISKSNTKLQNFYNDENVTYIMNYDEVDLDTAVTIIAELYISKEKPKNYNSKSYTSFNDLYDAIYNNIKQSKKEQNPEKTITHEEIRSDVINILINILGIDKAIINHLVNAKEKGVNNLSNKDESRQFFEDVAKNNMFYLMVKDEAKKINEFWKKVVQEYKTTYNTDAAIKAIKNYADGLNSNADWPQSMDIKVGNTNYELYTFLNPHKTPKQSVAEIPYVEEDMDNLENSIGEPTIDLNDIKDIRENDPITIFDYEYWLVYMLNATLFTLIPTYWADGFDVPPFMVPLLLPAIYLPIAPPVMIPIVNVLMVFGIALRGMWPAPIILMINLSSDDIDVMVFLKIALEIAKDIFKKIQELVENTIPMMVNEILNGYLNENEIAQKAIEKFRTYSSIISAIPIEDKALIERKFNDALYEELNKPSKLNDANAKLSQTTQNIQSANKQAQINVNQKMDNAARKAREVTKSYDRRQVIMREADLGNGPEPM